MPIGNLPQSARPAFTLIELLVTLAIITILLALICPAIGRARTVARQTRELSSGAQLMRAYTTYSGDFRGWVLPGYVPNAWTLSSPVRDLSGQPVIGQSARRYPWRIAPYLDFTFAGLYDDRNLLERYTSRPDYQYVVGLSPSMGINADFVGGNDENGLAFNAQPGRPYGRFYVQKIDDAQRPASLLVFASSRGVDPDGGTVPGFHRIDAPSFTAARWSTSPQGGETPPEAHGQVHARFAGSAVISFLDGHGEGKNIDDLRDMRLWADRATEAGWLLRPNP